MSGGPTSVNLKLVILVIAIFIAGGTYFYTQTLVKKLQEREKNIVELYAESLEYIANSSPESQDYTFVFDIIQRIDFPLILTDAKDNIISGRKNSGIRNIDIDSTLTKEEFQNVIRDKIVELGSINSPILVKLDNEIVIQKIYYGDSEIITRLIYYPYFQIISAIIFLLIAYVSFSYMKRTEQSNIWVGMSKETAHQLGTPISSLMGWNEILEINFKNPDKVLDISNEMRSDLERLNKIAQRFSKIGSKPELKERRVFEVINGTVNYFQRRLPQFGKNVKLVIDGDKEVKAFLNAELLEWVFENLIKNALDAIGKEKRGEIIISVYAKNGNVAIDVTDNGVGIDLKRRKDVFRPGYSTKKRGWGLGLSLAKRIIENYHNGKLTITHSEPGEGTTFTILLNRAKNVEI